MSQLSLKSIPPDIRCAQDYEFLARQFMASASYEYVAGGSGHDHTLVDNRKAFAAWSVYPRLLNELTAGHTRLSLLGRELAHPILLAPVAFQKLAHPGGELETARAAAATDACMVVSTLSTHSLERVAEAAGSDRWFQLYFQARREDTLDLLRRAEASGYQAIVVTLDASIQAPSLRALRAGFCMPEACAPANLTAYQAMGPVALGEGQSRIFQGLMSQAPTWRDLDWLQSQTCLPIWIKGVLHPDDARTLQSRGVAGLIVSNHGGRSLDGAPASLQALPQVRQAVDDALPVLLDSGVRSGTDVFKALACGADAVLIGRLQVYALAVAGALGVAHMIKLLREELEICMSLAGCATLKDIQRAGLTPSLSPTNLNEQADADRH